MCRKVSQCTFILKTVFTMAEAYSAMASGEISNIINQQHITDEQQSPSAEGQIEDESGGGSACDIPGGTMAFSDKPGVYYSTTEKTIIGQMGKIKMSERVFKTKVACFYCGTLQSKYIDHIMSQHRDEQAVKRLQHLNDTIMPEVEKQQEREKILTQIRNKGNHNHNLKVIQKGEGLLIISRAPAGNGPYLTTSYNPCPTCYLWVKNLARHTNSSNRCKLAKTKVPSNKAKYLSNELKDGASCHDDLSYEMKKEILMTMKDDEVNHLIKNDGLLLKYGNKVLKENYSNTIMRGKYTKDKLRLVARVVLAAKKESDITSTSDLLQPTNFNVLMRAIKTVSGMRYDDINHSLDHPTNATKVAQHLKEVARVKEADAIISNATDKDKVLGEIQEFEKLLASMWRTEIGYLASATISERNFMKKQEIPHPDDLRKLADILTTEANRLGQSKITEANYIENVEVAMARLLTYNKRRPGELDATRRVWAENKAGREEHFAAYMKDLTSLEEKLLNTHDVFNIRGKRGRPVPVLVPPDTRPIINNLLTDPLKLKSRYLFSSAEDPSKVMSSADALNKYVLQANCEKPDLIKTTLLRKYMSTTVQVMSLRSNEIKWVMDLLGHTQQVDDGYYRMMSSTVMRAKVAKLLLLADRGSVDEFKGKNLDDIEFDKIPVQDEEDEKDEDDLLDKEEGRTDIPQNHIPLQEDPEQNEHLNQEHKQKHAKAKKHPSSEFNLKRKYHKKITSCNNVNDSSGEEWVPENSDDEPVKKPKLDKTTSRVWNEESRDAYNKYIAPEVERQRKMPSKIDVDKLRKKSTILTKIPYRFIRNKMNAHVQKLKRRN